MNTLIIFHSFHHRNTEKVARVIAQTINSEVVEADQNKKISVSGYDMIGFGSGYIMDGYPINLYELLNMQSNFSGKKAFVFSTAGSISYGNRANDLFAAELEDRGLEVKGKFCCPGFDTALSAKGINHGRPHDKDLDQARSFALSLIK
ncbi:MAG: flavodoxin [Actinomycetota bacterium]|nr:flavodoxin [Actinomycetota bacterium]